MHLLMSMCELRIGKGYDLPFMNKYVLKSFNQYMGMHLYLLIGIHQSNTFTFIYEMSLKIMHGWH